MAITDLQVSDTLETSAPSIKYEGNEGPQSPQQEQQVAQLKREYMQYVFEQKDLQEPVMSFEEWYQAVYEASRMGVQAPQEEITTEEVMRAPAAYGGIMDVGGRRRYGIGSWLKEKARKIIPNELATVARVAAPFVAPFNPLAAGLMSGIGGFDKHGSIGRGLKSGLMTYGGGQLARGIGGGLGNLQTGFDPRGGMNQMGSGLTKYFSNPMQKSGGLGKMWDQRGSNLIEKKVTDISKGGNDFTQFTKEVLNPQGIIQNTETGKGLGLIKQLTESTAAKIILGASAAAGLYTAATNETPDLNKLSRGLGMDIDGIRAEVQEALAGGEEAWNELKKKYPYIGEFATKKAEGGRIGLYAGGQSIPSDYTMEDARKTSMQDKMGGITEIMKQADLSRKGDVGQMYAAEGGLMDLGGMEKDYRNEGGFVPIGGKEKADDVPARLSKNEFVFTADAVRGAGGGDIDKGAEIMENIMKNLEQGGQISEETQGLTGAQEMFGISERLSEVI